MKEKEWERVGEANIQQKKYTSKNDKKWKKNKQEWA